MNKDIEGLNTSKLEIIKELGNIGAGNAVTALSKLINKKVNMKVPKMQILDFKEIPAILGKEEDLIAGVLLPIKGDISGYIMFVINTEAAHNLVDILFDKRECEKDEFFSDIEISALKEVGNIMAGSYLSALATLTNLKIIADAPDISIDMAGAILSVPAMLYGSFADSVLYIENQFIDGNEKVMGEFFLISDADSYEVLLKTLGVSL